MVVQGLSVPPKAAKAQEVEAVLMGIRVASLTLQIPAGYHQK